MRNDWQAGTGQVIGRAHRIKTGFGAENGAERDHREKHLVSWEAYDKAFQAGLPSFDV